MLVRHRVLALLPAYPYTGPRCQNDWQYSPDIADGTFPPAASGDGFHRKAFAEDFMPTLVKNELNVYECAEARFEMAASKLGLEEGLYRFLQYPNKEITIYIPVTMDDGRLQV